MSWLVHSHTTCEQWLGLLWWIKLKWCYASFGTSPWNWPSSCSFLPLACSCLEPRCCTMRKHKQLCGEVHVEDEELRPLAKNPHRAWLSIWMTPCFFFLCFFFFFFNWGLITLQYCSRFCHTFTWISHGFTCVPCPVPPSHLPPHPIPLGHPSSPWAPCLMHWTWTGDLLHIW